MAAIKSLMDEVMQPPAFDGGKTQAKDSREKRRFWDPSGRSVYLQPVSPASVLWLLYRINRK